MPVVPQYPPQHDPPQRDPWQPRHATQTRSPGTPQPIRHGPPIKPLSQAAATRVLLAWSAIGLFTVLTIIVQRAAMDLPILDADALVYPSQQITLQGKVAILLAGNNTGYNPQAQQAMNNVAAAAQTPADLVRYTIIAAEVQGPDAALGVIQGLRQRQNIFSIPADQQHKYELSEDDFNDLDDLEAIYTGQPLDQNAENRLIDRHGWFGEVASTFNQPANSSDYKEPRSKGIWVVVVLGAASLFLLLLGIAGITMLIIAIVRLSQGRIAARFNAFPSPRETPALVESIAIFLALFAGTGLLGVYMIQNHRVDPGLIGLILITLCPLLPLCYGLGWKRFRELTGLHRGEGFFKEVGCGLIGYISGLPLIACGFLISLGLFLLFPVDLRNPAIDQLGGIGPLGVILLVLMVAVWAPVVEEILFRGIFYSHCRRWMPWPLAAAIVGIVFAAIHPQWVWFIPGLASVGFVLAQIREWRGSLIGSMTAHAFHNGMIACLLIALLLT